MINETFTLSRVLAYPPFKLPNVRSSFRGNIVHIGVLAGDFRLRAACHAATNKVKTAQPTSDLVSCSNCLSRERQGRIPRSGSLELPPALVRSALSIWRTALGELREAVRSYELRRFLASIDDGVADLPTLDRIPQWLAIELVYAFDLYREVADGPVVTDLIAEVAARMRKIAFRLDAQEDMAA